MPPIQSFLNEQNLFHLSQITAYSVLDVLREEINQDPLFSAILLKQKMKLHSFFFFKVQLDSQQTVAGEHHSPICQALQCHVFACLDSFHP